MARTFKPPLAGYGWIFFAAFSAYPTREIDKNVPGANFKSRWHT